MAQSLDRPDPEALGLRWDEGGLRARRPCGGQRRQITGWRNEQDAECRGHNASLPVLGIRRAEAEGSYTPASMNHPLLVVGIPVYNGEDHLEDALDSVAAQTMGDFLAVISDNSSTDGTESLSRARELSDPRFRYVRQPRDLGAVQNFNYLVHNTESPYFAWKSDDDLWAPTYLESCLSELGARHSAVLACTELCQISADGETVTERIAPSSLISDTRVARRIRPMIDLDVASQVYGVIRREQLVRTHLFRPCWGADHRLLLELSLLGPFAIVGEILYAQRVYEERSPAQLMEALIGPNMPESPLREPYLDLFAGLIEDVFAWDLSAWERLACAREVRRRFFDRQGRAHHILVMALGGAIQANWRERQMGRLLGLAGLRFLIHPRTPLEAACRLAARW